MPFYYFQPWNWEYTSKIIPLLLFIVLNPSEQIHECLQLQSSPLQPGASAQDSYIKVTKWIQHTVSSILAHLSQLSIRRLQWILKCNTEKEAHGCIKYRTAGYYKCDYSFMLQQSWKEFGLVEWSPCWQGRIQNSSVLEPPLFFHDNTNINFYYQLVTVTIPISPPKIVVNILSPQAVLPVSHPSVIVILL